MPTTVVSVLGRTLAGEGACVPGPPRSSQEIRISTYAKYVDMRIVAPVDFNYPATN